MVVIEVPEVGCYFDEGFADKVAILVFLLSHGLRLPFYCPLRDILDLLNLVPAKLHPFALRTYLCACVVFCMVLEPLGDPYLDLTAQEFLSFYSVRLPSKGNMDNFQNQDKGQALTRFETRYSNAKVWTYRFFFISRKGQDFSTDEDIFMDFSVRAIWGPLKDDKTLWATMVPLFLWEQAHIETTCS